MKLKKYFNTKNISKILTLAVLLNSTPINSFASIVSDDLRYETFEGDNLTIDNVLEEDKVDVEIEGNTLVNYVDYNKLLLSKGASINETLIYLSNYIDYENTDTINNSNVFVKASANLQTGETYTAMFNIANNDIKGEQFISITNTWENNDFNEVLKINKPEVGLIKLKFIVENSQNGELGIYLSNFKTQDINGSVKIKDLMILKGDWTGKDIPEYFSGMKSIGENIPTSNQVTIKSVNKKENLYKKETPIGGDTLYLEKTDTGFKFKGSKDNSTIRIWDVIDGRDTYSVSGYIKSNSENSDVFTVDICDSFTKAYSSLINGWTRFEIEGATLTSEKIGVSPYTFVDITLPGNNDVLYEVKELKIEKNPIITPYDLSKDNIDKYNRTISLNEPLRGLPNGVKDRIIKKNGEWVIERNCAEYVITQKDEFYHYHLNTIYDSSKQWSIKLLKNIDKYNNSNAISNNLPTIHLATVNNNPTPAFSNYTDSRITHNNFYFNITWDMAGIVESDTNNEKTDKVKQWLIDNNTSIIYERETPYYEPLSDNAEIYLYIGTTLVSSDSTIPANLKVTVDRVANRAKEYSELAKESPTLYNISMARMWINLMRESILKDEFHDTIDTITEVSDMVLEKKKASANLDLYIKSENSLSMSLNTNSISFDDFSGVEDMTKENAVTININSSLPYQLNSYLATDIQNADKSNSMNLDILSIKENSELNYQKFSAINSKLILKSNCESGNNKQHNIDLKLNGSIAHQKDVYKTTIKFEAEQL